MMLWECLSPKKYEGPAPISWFFTFFLVMTNWQGPIYRWMLTLALQLRMWSKLRRSNYFCWIAFPEVWGVMVLCGDSTDNISHPLPQFIPLSVPTFTISFYCPRLSRCISSLNQEIGLILYFFFSYGKLTKTNIPVNVNISFAIEDVIKIEEINHKFHLKDKRVFLKTCLSLIYTFFHRMFELNSILSIFLSIWKNHSVMIFLVLKIHEYWIYLFQISNWIRS